MTFSQTYRHVEVPQPADNRGDHTTLQGICPMHVAVSARYTSKITEEDQAGRPANVSPCRAG